MYATTSGHNISIISVSFRILMGGGGERSMLTVIFWGGGGGGGHTIGARSAL